MAEILPRHFIYGIIVFTFLVVGGTTLLSEFNKADPTLLDDPKFTQFNKTFNTLENISDSVGGIESGIQGTDVDAGTFGVLNGLINSGWNSLKLLYTSFGFMSDAIGGLSESFGIPAFIPALLILFISVLISFSIFSVIFQREI